MGVVIKDNVHLSDDYIITTSPIEKKDTEGLGITIYNHMKANKDKIAQIDARSGQTQSYQELLTNCIRTSLHLRDRNITKDDIVSLCTTNHLNAVVPWIAVQFLGAKMAVTDPFFSKNELTHLLKVIRPKILFVLPEVEQTTEEILKELSLNSEIVVFGLSSNHTEFSEFLSPHVDETKFQPVEIKNVKDTAVIYFSSGTTGLPKGICTSHYSIITQIRNGMSTEYPDFEYMKSQQTRLSFPLTVLTYTTLYWISGSAMLLSSFFHGFTHLMVPDFDGEEVWSFITKYKPITLTLTPIQAMEMLAKKPKKNVYVRSVLSVLIVGSALSKKYLLKLRKEFPEADVTVCYGQTEVAGVLTSFKGNDLIQRPLMLREEKIESVGRPVRGLSCKVVDLETGKNLGPNQKGEFRVKTDLVMNGYYNADSSDAFDENGWLKTGDVVYYDEDYCFYIVDRIKESFKYKGWFIAPVTLENELLKHPAVKYAVVIGVPRDDGYHPMGVVVLNDGFEVRGEELEKFVEERVPERQRLRAGVKIIESIPLTPTGKIKRREVKEMILGRHI